MTDAAPPPPQPAPPVPTRTWARRVARVALGALGFMTAQVVAVRFITPPATLSMVQSAAATLGSEEGPRWVDYRPLAASDLGEQVARSAVASEDGWFFQHTGFDLGQLHAVLSHLGSGNKPRGASTISQQVAKNVFLWQGRSYVRKALEVPYTILLELLVPKERILELYLNVAQTGPLTYGMEAGAQRWYQKPASDLSAQEAARLISLLPYPEGYTVTEARATERAREILSNRVPFPGDPGFETMAEQAPGKVGWRALLGLRD
jgi:monofunctional biosynthetic peptidoglycan transglycosylase